MSDITTDSATLSWEVPKSDGGSPVSHYIIEERMNSEGEFVQALIADGSTCSVTIDGLTPDSNYEFRVFAQNEAGSSESPAAMKTPVTTAKAIGKIVIFSSTYMNLVMLRPQVGANKYVFASELDWNHCFLGRA